VTQSKKIVVFINKNAGYYSLLNQNRRSSGYEDRAFHQLEINIKEKHNNINGIIKAFQLIKTNCERIF